MGDQPAVPVDDIGIAGAPDLHRSDQIPDKFEIDLGNGNPGVMPGMRDRNRHIGFGLLRK